MKSSISSMKVYWTLVFTSIILSNSYLVAQTCNPTAGTFTQKPCIGIKDVVTNDSFCVNTIYNWSVNNGNYAVAGTYTFPTTNQNGCEYTEILNLVEFPNTPDQTVGAEFCPGGTYTWPANGQTYSVPGIYTATSTDPNGCTYVQTLVLSYDVQGCTDPLANNYDPNAVCDDGSCITAFTGCICGDTWIDNDRDGINTFIDPELVNVTVSLYQGGSLIATTTTDPAGSYCFDELPDGNYTVDFESVPGFEFTTQDVGADDSVDSDADPDGEEDVSIVNGLCGTTTDAGYIVIVGIGGTVFSDDNNNGIQDASETGFAGADVELLDANFNPIFGPGGIAITETTDANGDYYFGGLAPGNYRTRVTPPLPFLMPSFSVSTVDDQVDCDNNGSVGPNGGPAISPVINLAQDAEPVNGGGGEICQGALLDDADDNNGDMTIDFGFNGGIFKSGNK